MGTLSYVIALAMCMFALAGVSSAASAQEPPSAEAMQEYIMHQIRFGPFCFDTSEFPSCDFDDPDAVEGLIGPYTITASFYDGAGNPVTSAEKPGRYAAVVEVHRANDLTSKRFVTLFRLAGAPSTSDENAGTGQTAYMQDALLDAAGIDKTLADDHKDEFEQLNRSRIPRTNTVTPAQGQSTQKETIEAFMVAALHDLTALKAAGKPVPGGSLMGMERQWWVGFKRHYYGYDKVYSNEFVCPAVMDGETARVLREGTPAEAGMADNAVETIDAACEAWVKDVGIGFSLCVVRHGVIVVNKGYGTQARGPEADKAFTASTRGPLASTTKFLSAVLLLEFVDRGLIGLDEPVGTYIPALRNLPSRTTGRPLTFRDCYVHTGGFTTHWGDLANDLEEGVADLYPTLEVGLRHRYEGTGLALGGKLMEMMSGDAIPTLYRKHLFDPLGCVDTEAEFTSYGSLSTAIDLTRIGQMVLNGGVYGDKRFFHPGVIRSMMPVPGRDRFEPDTTVRWGVGIKQFDIDGLSDAAMGHPGASGSCVVVEPSLDLVISMVRFEEGGEFRDFLKKKSVMYKAIVDSIKD